MSIHRTPRYFILIACALYFSSCVHTASPATPINMAPMYIPKSGTSPETPTSPAIPTATYMPNAQTINVSIWVPGYLAESLGSALEDPLRGLFVSEAAMANIRLEVGEANLVSQWVYALATPFSSTMQGISGDDLLLRWQGGSSD